MKEEKFQTTKKFKKLSIESKMLTLKHTFFLNMFLLMKFILHILYGLVLLKALCNALVFCTKTHFVYFLCCPFHN